MSVWTAILLGLVQGIAEFLPISSSGHLSVLQNLLGLDYAQNENMLFDVLLHMGTLVSVFLYYRKEFCGLGRDMRAFVRGDDGGTTSSGKFTPKVRTLFFILVATLPLVVILPFHKKMELLYSSTTFIAIAFLVTGCLLFVSDRLMDGTKGEKTLTAADALMIGAAQAVAVLPGVSRSGTTITVGLSRGLRREFAVRFSFLMSIPAVIGSALITLIDAVKAGIRWSAVPVYLIGMIVAGITGYFAIKLVNLLISKSKFGSFAYYCWAVGAVTLILSIVL